jgi:hypothetical protein
LHRKLAPLLPADITIEHTRAVHATTFRIEAVRVGRELSDDEISPVMDGVGGISFQALDNAALKRELKELRDQLAGTRAQNTALMHERDALQDQLIGEISLVRNQLNEAHSHRAALEQAQGALCDRLRSQAACVKKYEAQLSVLESERDMLRAQVQYQHAGNATLAQEVAALRASRSWRITRPVRALGSVLRLGLRLRSTR